MNNEQTIALPSGYQLENYRLETVLGHGGFGITYRAKDGDLQKTVAVKEYLPREVAFRGQDSTVIPLSQGDRETFEWGLERFLDEARTLARFGHPNIVGVHRFLRAHGTAYLVMDYCEGESLESMLAREGTLAPDRLEAMLVPLLNALEVLHAAGVTHRDIKPGNIYLRDDGSPVLLDFGAARQALAQHSRSVTAMATQGYAAFEQYSTKGKQGPWTDIYGLGATLYRCVTGEKPPDASDRMLDDELVPAVEMASGRYPKPLLQQIDAALQLRPQDRPQNIAAWRRFGLGGEVLDVARRVPASPQAVVRRHLGGLPLSGDLIAGRYRILGTQGEIVEDIETGLQWMRCSLGQTWNGHTCVGKAHGYTWKKARDAAEAVPGWRLPTIEELKTLVYCSTGSGYSIFGKTMGCGRGSRKPTIVHEAFPNTPEAKFWSGSPGGTRMDPAWNVAFYNGTTNHDGRSSSNYRVYRVRLVRGGQ